MLYVRSVDMVRRNRVFRNIRASLVDFLRSEDGFLGSLLGGIVGAGASLLGASMSADAAEDNNAANIGAQKEFAQHGIQWKVDDARAAGVHPLFALGAQTTSFAPSYTGDTSIGPGVSQAGQEIGRAIASTSTDIDRKASGVLGALAVERGQLENDLLRSQIARLNSAQIGPPMPTNNDPYLIAGQGNSAPTAPGVMMQPSMITAFQDGQTGKEAGVVADYSYTRTAKGGLAPVASNDVKQRIEDAFIPEMSHAWRNNITPNLPWNWSSHATKPPKSALPAGAGDWMWDMSDQSWVPVARSAPARLRSNSWRTGLAY